jgi:hypothetical protein
MPAARTLGIPLPAAFLVAVAPLLGCVGSGSKTFDAVATASAAGALTVANEVERSRAEREATRLREQDDACPVWECYAGKDMTLDEARAYTVAYVNHARTDVGLGALAVDYSLNAFAQLGSKALARDHRPHRHLIEESGECPGCAETQSDPAGLAAAPVHDQLDAALGYMLSEGPGGPSHDVLVGATWHRMGIGIVNPDGKMYVTVDVAP